MGNGFSDALRCQSAAAALALVACLAVLVGGLSRAHAQDQKSNILVIMGDDVGWFNIGAYHQGIVSGKTPVQSSGHKGTG